MSETLVTGLETVFYVLPVELIEEGMSTADGQDFLDSYEEATFLDDGTVWLQVYTPSDDEDEDEANACSPESRMYAPHTLVSLAVFPNTQVDGRDRFTFTIEEQPS